jgi:predicted DCC family thiol-disulfide oxidoreductase YuxK
MFDWAYRLIANHREQFFPQTKCMVPPPHQKDRFLP